MPTYDYQCTRCHDTTSVFQSIHDYCRTPIRPQCIEGHGEMERRLSVVPGLSGLANALAGDRHYDGLTATDGTPIDTRTKHREYMKSHDLAMADDFKNTWAQAQQKRELARLGKARDPELRSIITEQVQRSVACPD